MASNVIMAAGVQPGSTSITKLYDSPVNGGGTRIIGFTAYNTDASPQTYGVYIVPSGGSPDGTNNLIPPTSLAVDDSESPPELQNQLIGPGGSLYVVVSTGATVGFYATGIEF